MKVRGNRIHRLDASASLWLQSRPISEAGRGILSMAAHSGDSLFVFPALALAWWLSVRGAYGGILHAPAFAISAAAVGATAFAGLIKLVFRRARPEGEWGSIYRRTDPHSFPSAHAARTFAIAISVFSLVDPVYGAIFLAWSLSVGFARVFLGVHWLGDIVAGWLLGALAGVAAVSFLVF